MINRFLSSAVLTAVLASFAASAQPSQSLYFDHGGAWDNGSGSDESSGGASYLGVDIADVSAERLSDLKLKEEHGAEVTMVDQDAPAGKAGLKEHDVIVSVNGMAVESAAQLRRIIKETPAGRIVNLGISRDGQPVAIKVQLADRHKSMEWEPENHFKMPKVTSIPSMPDFDLPVSVVVVHSSARSGIMVENMTPQLGDFFGVKDGNGVLVRSVEKGSRGEKAGFHAGDVVVKVNNQPVHDSSDFSHALRSSPSNTASVTIVRDRKERNLTLTLPDKKDSGTLDSFDIHDFTAQTEDAINWTNDELARMTPAIVEKLQSELEVELPENLRQQSLRCQKMQKKVQESEQKMREKQQQIQKQQRRILSEMSGKWTEI